MARVLIEKVCKVYPGHVTAVRDFSLDIEHAEFVVLVGPSGCGKSTTLRMVAGLEDITSGTISIDGKVVNDMPPKDRDIAMVFQNYALYPHMSVFDNVAFGLKLRGYSRPEIESRVREAADLLGLGELLKRKPKELSGGQRQRVALGRAIVRHPKVFLFDEPLSNLDAKLRVQMRAELSRLHSQINCTMIYVTHDQVEAMTMGDRIVVMKDGLIQQVAAPLGLYNDPTNLFVGGFIGSPPMNFFSGKIAKTAAGPSFLCDGFSVSLAGDAVGCFAGHDGKEVIMGIRPEDVFIKKETETLMEGQLVRTRIDVVEPMGADIYLNLVAGTQGFVARVEPDHDLRINQELDVAFDMRKAHCFDAVTKASLKK